MTTYFLTPLQWLTVLTDSIWIPFHPRILFYQRPQGSWTHGTSVFEHYAGKSMFWPYITDQTMNTHFLSPLQCLIVLTDSIWTPLHPWEMLYHAPEGFLTSGKTVLPWRQVNVLAILLDKTMNTHFLSPLQWHTVPTGCNQIPVHLWNMLYQGHKALQHLENQYYHKHQSMFWPFPIDQTMTKHILSPL